MKLTKTHCIICFTVYSPTLNLSWYEANEACASHNATLLTLSDYRDLRDVQTFLFQTVGDTLPAPVFVGLQLDDKVSVLPFY